MYFAGVPEQDQVIVPVEVLAVGVTVIVKAWPVEMLAVLPAMAARGSQGRQRRRVRRRVFMRFLSELPRKDATGRFVPVFRIHRNG